MVTVKQIIAQQKKEMTKQEYKLILKMCKMPKPFKQPKKKRL